MSFHRSLALLLLGWVSAAAQPAAPQPPASQPAPAAAPPAVPVNPAAEAPQPVVPAPAPSATPAAPGTPAGARPVTPAPAPGRNAAAAQAPAPVGAANAAAKPAVPLGETKIVEDIIEPKLSGDALAGLWRKYTGRRVIVTSAAATAEFHFVQEATPQDPLTYSKAAELLRIAAQLENFSFVPHPLEPEVDVLTLATGGPRPTNITVDVYNENTPLPETDVVISYVMTLSHIKPDQALNIFTQIIGQFGAYGSIAAVPNASAVVITEKTSLIKSLIDLKKTIDVPGSVQSSKFVKVQYADVSEIATTLTDLLTAQQSAQQTAGVQRNNPAPQPGAAPNPAAAQMGGGGSGGGEDTPVQIIPEPRTNRIFVMGRPVDILFVEGLVREFDIPSSEKTFLRRKLRFLTVSEFLPIAGDALTRAFSGTGDSGGSTGTTGGAGGGATGGGRTQSSNRSSSSGTSSRGSTSSRNSSSGFGNNSSGFGGGGSSGFGGGGSSGFGGGGTGGGSALSDPNISSAPESMLVGRTLLVADNITNSIVAQGPPSALEVIERLLDQLDVKPDQVMISTVIGQLTLNDKLDAGVSYLFKGEDILGGGGAGFPSIPSTSTGTGGATTTSNGFPIFDRNNLAAGGLRAFGTVGDMRIFLKALQEKTDFTVLSRPSIFTSNNQKGSISSGERIAIPTNSNSFSNGGASTNIEYQDVVLKLEVIPLVNSDNDITMQIALLNDEQNGTQTIAGGGSNGQDLTVPKISTREILTTVTVPNNDTIVLGGLIVGRNGKSKSGIPFLSDIPYLGPLFGTNVNTNDRSELMVLMQPSIVRNASSLADVQTDMDSRYRITPKIQNFADNGVLPSKPETKGKNSGSRFEPTATSSENANMKPSIRPIHKR